MLFPVHFDGRILVTFTQKVKLSNIVLNKCKFNRNVADFVFIVQQIITLQGLNMASESHKDQVVLLHRAATAV